jgi:hypothetical protein
MLFSFAKPLSRANGWSSSSNQPTHANRKTIVQPTTPREAVAAQDVVRAEGRRRIRGSDGRSTRPLHGAARQAAAGRQLRRHADATHWRSTGPDPAGARPARTNRLRVLSQRHGRSLCLRRCASSLAHVRVTDHRTNLDFACCMRDLVDVHYPNRHAVEQTEPPLNVLRSARRLAEFDMSLRPFAVHALQPARVHAARRMAGSRKAKSFRCPIKGGRHRHRQGSTSNQRMLRRREWHWPDRRQTGDPEKNWH